jgi:hypothetical protein
MRLLALFVILVGATAVASAASLNVNEMLKKGAQVSFRRIRGKLGCRVKAGGVRIEIRYRRLGKDSGLSFQVYGGKRENAREVLRFDCFQLRPHFHLIGSGRSKMEQIDKETAPDPVKWTLTRLKKDLRSLILQAGREKLADEIDQSAVASALSKVEKKLIG